MKALKIDAARSAPRSGGFTVMEAIVAMGVTGVLIISLYAALSSGFNAVQLGREDMRATQILVKKMDQLRLFSWDQITNNAVMPTSFLESFNPENGTPTLINGYGYGSTNGNAYGQTNQLPPLVFSGTVSLGSFPDNTPAYSPNMRQVTIHLDWTSQSGLPRSRTLTTFVARYGLQNYIY